MKKIEKNVSIFKRAAAFLLDTFIVYLVVSCLGGVAFINPNYEKYSNTYDEYMSTVEEYVNFQTDYQKYYEDSEITEKEYEDLTKNYEQFTGLINKYYDNGITEDNNDKLTDEFMDSFSKLSEDYSYKLEKYNIIPEILLIVCTLLYFVIFTYFVDGVSLGKKIFKLKVVKNDGSKVGIVNLLLRTIFITEIFSSILSIIFVLVFKANVFYRASLVVSVIKMIIELTIVILIAYRKDGRGLHDLVANTKVINTKEE